MSKEVEWTLQRYDFFVEKAMLSDDEAFIMRTRIQGWSVSQQAETLGRSESTIHKTIANLKKKYDIVQSEYPDRLPPRKKSDKEKWMDTH